MSGTYQQPLQKTRARYPKAYPGWSEAEKLSLKKAFVEGLAASENAGRRKRRPGAIRSHELSWPQAVPTSPIDTPEFELQIPLVWEAVRKDAQTIYRYPDAMNLRMRHQYHDYPAIYRWKIYANDPAQISAVYIGQTKDLYEQINIFLDPTNPAINRRLSFELDRYLVDGFCIELETLHANDESLGPFCRMRLELPAHRLFLERLIIRHYAMKGVLLLNTHSASGETLEED